VIVGTIIIGSIWLSRLCDTCSFQILEITLRELNVCASLHCHHHAVIKPKSEQWVLDRLGLAYEFLPSGCCGMAGSFGFEAEKYDVSMTAAERVLLPRIRTAAPDTILLANGFSCREQIEQATGRKTTHVAELIGQSL
jgi:Fe-S oxidoreductase